MKGLTRDAVLALHLFLDGILPPRLGDGIPTVVTMSQHTPLKHCLGCHDPILSKDKGVLAFCVRIACVSTHNQKQKY